MKRLVPDTHENGLRHDQGLEIMRMIRPSHCILIAPGVTGEVRFVNKLFDLAA